jgi:hypothetical protein
MTTGSPSPPAPDVTGPVPTTAAAVAAAVEAFRYRYRDEADLQAAITAALASAGFPVAREVDLGPHGRIDLLVGRIGVEVKTDACSAAVVAGQLQRYARSDRVDALVLATTRVRHRSVPRTLHGTPVLVVPLSHPC